MLNERAARQWREQALAELPMPMTRDDVHAWLQRRGEPFWSFDEPWLHPSGTRSERLLLSVRSQRLLSSGGFFTNRVFCTLEFHFPRQRPMTAEDIVASASFFPLRVPPHADSPPLPAYPPPPPQWYRQASSGIVPLVMIGLGIVAIASHIRRSYRLNRGLCTRCGYPISRVSDVCTECGEAVSWEALPGAAHEAIDRRA